MQEFIEKLIGRLEELEVQAYAKTDGGATYQTYRNVIEMVIQLAEEHKQQLSNDLEIISSLPSLYPLQPFEEEAIHKVVESVNNNGWISYITGCKMPNEASRVWLSFTTPIASFVKSAWYINGHFEWDNCRRVKETPMAWKPYDVPAPYHPKGE